MSKKSFAILIIIILALFAAGYWYLFKHEGTAPSVSQTGESNTGIFPFGNGSGQGGTNTGTQTATSSTIVDLSSAIPDVIPRLRQLSVTPSAGVVAFDQGPTTTARFVDRATGHVFEAKLESADAPRKISSVTIPKVYEALWSADGTRFLARYLRDDNETIRTFYARIATTTKPEMALEGLFLDDGIETAASLGSRIFYFNVSSGVSQGIVANFDGSSRTIAYSSPFGGWIPAPAGGNLVALYSRPSGLSDGTAYILNTATGATTKAGEGKLGLSVRANADASRMISSSAAGNSIETAWQDLKKGTSAPIGLTTLADKCVWSAKTKSVVYCAVPQAVPAGLYPDDWYKGRVSFSDGLWRVDTATGATDSVMTPELEAGVSMDITNLSLDAAERTIVFINKKDLTPWAFSLGE